MNTEFAKTENQISKKRCFNHISREAAACCPVCKRFFCRECITEHDDRVICSSCLGKKVSIKKDPKTAITVLKSILYFTIGFFIIWIFFFIMGKSLLSLPDTFHKGTMWKSIMQELE